MTTLSKEDMANLIAIVGLDGIKSGDNIARFELLIEAARADLVAENERLKSDLSKYRAIRQYKEARKAEVAVLCEQLTEARAENERLKSEDFREMRQMLRAMQAGELTVSRGLEILNMWWAGNWNDNMLPPVRQDLIEEDSMPVEIIDRLNDQLTATRTALAAAEAREKKLREVMIIVCHPVMVAHAGPTRCKEFEAAVNSTRDDSALREMIAGVYEECAKVCEASSIKSPSAQGATRATMCAENIRALAEKAKGE